MDFPSHAAFGNSPEILARILEPHINIAIWHRSLNPRLAHWLDSLSPDLSKRIPYLERFYQGLWDSIGQSLEKRLYFQNTKAVRIENLFIADVLFCVKIFAEISFTKPVLNFRREGKGYGSTKFHDDGVKLRLLSTYRGVGTEWLPNEAVNRAALKVPESKNKDICRNPKEVRRLARGEVAIIKGSIGYETFPYENSLIHRSPGVANNADFRILITVN